MFHDLLTNSLYFGFITPNAIPIGTVAIYLHDVTDILIHISRLLNDLGDHEIMVAVCFFGAQVLWVWFRLFAFPMVIWSLYLAEY